MRLTPVSTYRFSVLTRQSPQILIQFGKTFITNKLPQWLTAIRNHFKWGDTEILFCVTNKAVLRLPVKLQWRWGVRTRVGCHCSPWRRCWQWRSRRGEGTPGPSRARGQRIEPSETKQNLQESKRAEQFYNP